MSHLQYEYIHFELHRDGGPGKNRKTAVWLCKNNTTGHVLGKVSWHSAWRQYVFFTEPSIVCLFSVGCLDDISAFIRSANEEHQKWLRAKRREMRRRRTRDAKDQ